LYQGEEYDAARKIEDQMSVRNLLRRGISKRLDEPDEQPDKGGKEGRLKR
jgi:hypothetical protein